MKLYLYIIQLIEEYHAHYQFTQGRRFGHVGRSPAFLDQLHLQAGTTVGLVVSDGCLVVEPKPRPHYTLAELLAASDYSQPQSTEDREWVDAPAVGGELI